jgi:hypothetical protein
MEADHLHVSDIKQDHRSGRHDRFLFGLDFFFGIIQDKIDEDGRKQNNDRQGYHSDVFKALKIQFERIHGLPPVQQVEAGERDLFKLRRNDVDAFFLDGFCIKILGINERGDRDPKGIPIDVFFLLFFASQKEIQGNHGFEIRQEIKAFTGRPDVFHGGSGRLQGIFDRKDKGIVDHLKMIFEFDITGDRREFAFFITVKIGDGDPFDITRQGDEIGLFQGMGGLFLQTIEHPA